MEIEIWVPGDPVAKGRPRVLKSGHAYTPRKTQLYENHVRLCWAEQSGKKFWEGTPIIAYITAGFPIPKSMSKRKREALVWKPHIKKPDADNVAKSILDALQGYAFENDSAVFYVVVKKVYAVDPGVKVELKAAKGYE